MLEVIEVSGFYAAGSNKLEYIFKHMKKLIQDWEDSLDFSVRRLEV